MKNKKKEIKVRYFDEMDSIRCNVEYLCAKIKIFVRALDHIAQSDDQANPIALRNKAIIALTQEPTTADKVNKFGGDTGKDADFLGPNDPGDEHHDRSAELAEFDKKMKEDAEAAWRDTVLHPEYKSEYEEEWIIKNATIVIL